MLVLTRLHNLVSKYIGNYFDELSDKENLGSWLDFEKKLNNIYGQKNNTVVAKAKLETL